MEAKRSDPNKCQARVWPPMSMYSYQCKKSIKVTRDGKGYCTVHDPVRKQAKIQSEYDKSTEERIKREKEFNKVKKLKENYPILVETLKNAIDLLKFVSDGSKAMRDDIVYYEKTLQELS